MKIEINLSISMSGSNILKTYPTLGKCSCTSISLKYFLMKHSTAKMKNNKPKQCHNSKIM